MNLKHGFGRIKFVLGIIGGILGAVSGVAIELNSHDMALQRLSLSQPNDEALTSEWEQNDFLVAEWERAPIVDSTAGDISAGDFWANLSTEKCVGLCVAAGSGAVSGCIFVLIALLTFHAICLSIQRAAHRPLCYIADSLCLGGKQMLCDIIKWTIIIIIAAVVFTIAYKIAISSGNGPVGAISGY